MRASEILDLLTFQQPVPVLRNFIVPCHDGSAWRFRNSNTMKHLQSSLDFSTL